LEELDPTFILLLRFFPFKRSSEFAGGLLSFFLHHPKPYSVCPLRGKRKIHSITVAFGIQGYPTIEWG
jgi:hypothetical protein